MQNTGDHKDEESMSPAHQESVVISYRENQEHSQENWSTRRIVKYPVKSIKYVKWLSVAQAVCGFVAVFAQIAPTLWYSKLFALHSSGTNVGLRLNVQDMGAGFISGFVTFIAGVIGLISSRRNIKPWIVSHLVLNLMALGAACNQLLFRVHSVTGIVLCQHLGSNVYRSRSHRRVGFGSTTTPLPTAIINILGEEITLDGKGDGSQHCFSWIFTFWMVLEAVMMLSALFTVVITFWLFVKNSKAACLCCTKCCAACCCCCTRADNSGTDDAILLNA